jgi:hypothetical protein
LILPAPCGPLSATVVEALRRAPDSRPLDIGADVDDIGDPLSSRDLQLALATCYELHYRGFDDVDDGWEWDPGLLAARAELEGRFLDALRAEVPRRTCAAHDISAALTRLVDADDGPPLSAHLLREGTAEQFREFARQRSVYFLHEADPHTWGIPRLHGRAKAALVEIQTDEYGGGRAEAMHSALFARSLRALDLDDTYGAHWGTATAATFATVNLMTYFGLHRRWRGALVGHLAALEMTSTSPNRRYGNGLRRLGFGAKATGYFDEHVEADAVHEQLAAVDLCGGLVEAEPELAGDVLWGAACCLAVEARFAADLLDRWRAGACECA